MTAAVRHGTSLEMSLPQRHRRLGPHDIPPVRLDLPRPHVPLGAAPRPRAAPGVRGGRPERRRPPGHAARLRGLRRRRGRALEPPPGVLRSAELPASEECEQLLREVPGIHGDRVQQLLLADGSDQQRDLPALRGLPRRPQQDFRGAVAGGRRQEIPRRDDALPVLVQWKALAGCREERALQVHLGRRLGHAGGQSAVFC